MEVTEKGEIEMFAVKTTYSFDSDEVVVFFGDNDAAKSHLKVDFEREIKIDRDENQWDSEGKLADDGCHAQIANAFLDHNDVTQWDIIEIGISDLSLGMLVNTPIYSVDHRYILADGRISSSEIEIREYRIGCVCRLGKCSAFVRKLANFHGSAIPNNKYPYYIVLGAEDGAILHAVMSEDGRFSTSYTIMGREQPFFWSKAEAEAFAADVRENSNGFF